ncbi:MAG: hypothetical protein ACPGOV_12195 [Magnetovibrionaceae bacterium]
MDAPTPEALIEAARQELAEDGRFRLSVWFLGLMGGRLAQRVESQRRARAQREEENSFIYTMW